MEFSTIVSIFLSVGSPAEQNVERKFIPKKCFHEINPSKIKYYAINHFCQNSQLLVSIGAVPKFYEGVGKQWFPCFIKLPSRISRVPMQTVRYFDLVHYLVLDNSVHNFDDFFQKIRNLLLGPTIRVAKFPKPKQQTPTFPRIYKI